MSTTTPRPRLWRCLSFWLSAWLIVMLINNAAHTSGLRQLHRLPSDEDMRWLANLHMASNSTIISSSGTPSSTSGSSSSSAPPSTGSTWTIAGDLLPLVLHLRPIGSEGHARVRQNLVDFFGKRLGYHVEHDRFTVNLDDHLGASTDLHASIGSLAAMGNRQNDSSSTSSIDLDRRTATFENVVFTKNPRARRVLTLAAHYDSKWEPEGFMGATDSAGPMAVLMDVALAVDRMLTGTADPSITLQFIFFDGEEPLISWRGRDNLYGSRHLAQLWATSMPTFPLNAASSESSTRHAISRLGQMDAMILLDLLGADRPFPVIHDYFPATQPLFEHVARIERQLRRMGMLEFDTGTRAEKNLFRLRTEEPTWSVPASIQDDHVPFMERGVPILHWIPSPFPAVWHTVQDDGGVLVPELLTDYARVLRVLVFQYLDIGSGRMCRSNGSSEAHT